MKTLSNKSIKESIKKFKKLSNTLVVALDDLKAGKITLSQAKTISQLANHAIRALTGQILLEQQLLSAPPKTEEQSLIIVKEKVEKK